MYCDDSGAKAHAPYLTYCVVTETPSNHYLTLFSESAYDVYQ